MHRNRNHQCDVCGKQNETEAKLTKHIEKIHTQKKCDHCGKMLPDAVRFRQHRKNCLTRKRQKSTEQIGDQGEDGAEESRGEEGGVEEDRGVKGREENGGAGV